MNKSRMWLSIIFFVVFLMLLCLCGGLAWFWSTGYQWWVVAALALGSGVLTSLSLIALNRPQKR
jgi:uncharacterized membrane protein AbrB (regulator of aidB expression)